MKMYASGWKKDGNVYSVQINDVEKGQTKQVKTVFKDWRESSIGWNLKTGELILIYSKEFKDQKDWLSWAKECPIKLSEIKVRDGKEEMIQLSCKEKKRAKK